MEVVEEHEAAVDWRGDEAARNLALELAVAVLAVRDFAVQLVCRDQIDASQTSEICA